METKKIMRDYTMRNYTATNWIPRKKMDKFLKMHSLSSLNQDQINMKGPKEVGRLKLVMKNTLTKKKKEPKTT